MAQPNRVLPLAATPAPHVIAIPAPWRTRSPLPNPSGNPLRFLLRFLPCSPRRPAYINLQNPPRVLPQRYRVDRPQAARTRRRRAATAVDDLAVFRWALARIAPRNPPLRFASTVQTSLTPRRIISRSRSSNPSSTGARRRHHEHRRAIPGGEGSSRPHRPRHQLRLDAPLLLVWAVHPRKLRRVEEQISGDGATVGARVPAKLRRKRRWPFGLVDLGRWINFIRYRLDRITNRYQPMGRSHVAKSSVKPRRTRPCLPATRPRPCRPQFCRRPVNGGSVPTRRRHVDQGLQREDLFRFRYV